MTRLRTLLALFAVSTLAVFVPAAPAAAQTSGYDNVTFWDDSPTPASPIITEVPDSDYHYLNPTGGRTPDDGLFAIVGKGRYQIVRDRDFQLYRPNAYLGTVMWLVSLDLNGTKICLGPTQSVSATHLCVPDVSAASHPWDSVVLSNGSDTSVKMTMTANLTDTTVTLAVTSSYDSAAPDYIFTEALLSASGSAVNQLSDINLYLGGDMLLDGNDAGAGTYINYDGKPLVAQVGQTATGGVRASGEDFTSYLADTYACFYGRLTRCNAPDITGTLKRGPTFAEPLPNYINPDPTTDTGVAGHWAIASLPATLSAQLMFASRSSYEEQLAIDLAPEPTGVTPAFCAEPPTLTIKPDPLEIAPGGAATVWVELTNLCRDLPTAPADALLSFSDGLTVIGTSDGVINLGQRAALQRFSLGPGEMLGWYAIVQATNPFVTAPLAIGEIFAGAAIVRTDSLNFTTPAPAPAPVVEAPAPAPAPAEPAALPVTLPNTGGLLPLLWLPALAAGLAGAGIALRRKRS